VTIHQALCCLPYARLATLTLALTRIFSPDPHPDPDPQTSTLNPLNPEEPATHAKLSDVAAGNRERRSDCARHRLLLKGGLLGSVGLRITQCSLANRHVLDHLQAMMGETRSKIDACLVNYNWWLPPPKVIFVCATSCKCRARQTAMLARQASARPSIARSVAAVVNKVGHRQESLNRPLQVVT